MTVGRLAPTPSGGLHLGNVTAFAAAWLSARSAGGRLLLRVEDIDTARARDHLTAAIREDLRWLGLTWDDEVAPQSARSYAEALARLSPHTYRCDCTRAQLAGGPYPGTCRDRGLTDGALRFRLPPGSVRFDDRAAGPMEVDPNSFGDPILVRRDGLVSYNLAVVTDDGRDGVTEVVRGADLLAFTSVQVRLHEALEQPAPTWLHAPLIVGADGRKLSKSHGDLEVAALRGAGWTPERVRAVVLGWLGLEDAPWAVAATRFVPARVPAGPFTAPPP